MRSRRRSRYDCDSKTTFTHSRSLAVGVTQDDVISKTVKVLLAGIGLAVETLKPEGDKELQEQSGLLAQPGTHVYEYQQRGSMDGIG